jgi:IS4 transposase
VKAHVLLDHDDYIPTFVHLSEAKLHDSKVLANIRLNEDSILAIDKAYNDYKQFAQWTQDGVYFVTRMKDNALYTVVEERDVPQNLNILSDEVIVLTGAQAQEKCPHELRRVVVWDNENEREIILLTNHIDFGATTISSIYKERWKIELFFKALKQNLKIKSFIGTSENALRIQFWTALIALLLLKWIHHLSKASGSFSNLASLLGLNLFTYRDLRDWLNAPFNTPPLIPPQEQLQLPLSNMGQATT